MSSTKIGTIIAFCLTFTMSVSQDIIWERDINWLLNFFMGLGGVAVFFVLYRLFIRKKV